MKQFVFRVCALLFFVFIFFVDLRVRAHSPTIMRKMSNIYDAIYIRNNTYKIIYIYILKSAYMNGWFNGSIHNYDEANVTGVSLAA